MVYEVASAAPFSVKVEEVTRRSANYHPTVWGDYFLRHHASNVVQSVDSGILEQQLDELKVQVRKMIVLSSAKEYHPSSHHLQLNLIDQIQRLGISYHFEPEIGSVLQHAYNIYNDRQHHQHGKDDEDDDEDDLNILALRFRLLRQQGYNISCDVFEKLKDSEGKFKKSLTSDVRGMLSLYEAAHMRVHGEDILEEALEFTNSHLESMIATLSNPLAAQVLYALNHPIHKGLERIEARRYISIFKEDDMYYNEVLSHFTKLDFNLLQKMHQSELSNITRWWKDLDFARKLPFARDRVVECYFWILLVYFEPKYSLARKFTTKIIAMTSVIDDIYDVYGTLEELILFADAIERWDISAMDLLPEYMRVCYRALLDVCSEMEQELADVGTSYRVDYTKAAMKKLVRAYLEEAKWLHGDYIPTIEEYMRVALVTCGYTMLATTSFVGMRENLVTNEAFEWVSNDPLIVKASSVICRLIDDMVGHEFEQERGHVASAIECYMKQHSVSKKEVFSTFEKQVMNAWKDINQECLRPTAVPMPLLMRVMNLTRFINLLYKDTDGYTDSKGRTKDLITSLLVDPVQM